MNRCGKKLSLLLLLFVLFSVQVFAQDAVSRALDLINKSIILGDYDKAYNYAKFVVNFYDGEEIPSDIQTTVSEAISERGIYLVSSEKWNDVLVMEEEIKNYPSAIKKALDPSVQKTRAHFKQVEEEKEKARLEAEKKLAEQKKQEEEEKLKAEREAETKRLIELYEQQKKLEQEKLAQQQKEEQEKLIAQQKLEQEQKILQQKLEAERLAQQQKLEEEKLAQQQKLAQEKLEQEIKLESERQAQLLKLEEERLALQKKLEEEKNAMLKQLEEQQAELQKKHLQETLELQKKQNAELEKSSLEKVTLEKDGLEKGNLDTLSQINLSEEDQKEIEKLKQASDESYKEEIAALLSEINAASNDALKSVSKNSTVVLIILFVIIFIFIGALVSVVLIWLKQSKIQQAQMKDTLMAMQAQSNANNLNNANARLEVFSLMLQMPSMSVGMGALENKSSLLGIGSDSNSTSSINNEKDEKAEIMNLINECRKYGKQIDETTGRKNVSTRVSDLVVKISQYLGYSEYDCILYYAAALVYDIGFLGIDSSLLKAGALTEAQFKQIQAHATLGEKMLFFVNSKYRNIFIDAVGKHHENLDGTGYPNGLLDKDIPYIARVLRVAESYIALVSNRSYKVIKDRDAAIADLRNSPNHYDKKIVDALDSII